MNAVFDRSTALAGAQRAPSPGRLTPEGYELYARVYWEDTDAGGVVFYANYLKFMERARTEWLRAHGVQQSAHRAPGSPPDHGGGDVDPDAQPASGGMFVVSETQARYLSPARLDDALRVTAQLHQLGTSSMLLGQQVYRMSPQGEQADTLLCEGSTRVVWVDAERLRPTRIPSQIAAVLGPPIGAPVPPRRARSATAA